MAGRKTKRTPETVDRICEGLRIGLTEAHACEYAGVSVDSLERWRKQNADFAERLREAKAKRRAHWLALLRKAGDKDWRAIADLLDRCEPEYRKKTEMAVTGKDGGPLLVFFGEDTKGPG